MLNMPLLNVPMFGITIAAISVTNRVTMHGPRILVLNAELDVETQVIIVMIYVVLVTRLFLIRALESLVVQAAYVLVIRLLRPDQFQSYQMV
jgi:hypothetical protein